MEVKNGNTVLSVTVNPQICSLLDEVAEQIGCSRSAVANYLVLRSLTLVRQVSPKMRVRKLQMGDVIRDHDEFMRTVVKRARGPSLAYIATALNALMTYAEEKYDPDL